MTKIEPSILTDFVARIFRATGSGEEAAHLVASSLVTSELAGHPSHGVVRVRQYLDSITAGELNPATEPVISHETASISVVDAKRGFGQLGAHFAISVAIDKAQASGLAAAGLFNCYHVGRLGQWVEMAADQNMIGLAFCNGGRPGGLVTPHGGAARLLGTNPVAAAVPVSGRPALIMDFSTSAVAEGKVRVARNRNESVPEGWILASDGTPSTRPGDLYDGGALLPVAGHKGYGLSLLVEFLAGVLTRGGCPALPGFIFGNNVLFLVLDIEAFRPLEAFLDDGRALCERVEAVPPAAGFDEVLLPGEPEHRATRQSRGGDIIVDETTWNQLTAAAGDLDVQIPSQTAE